VALGAEGELFEVANDQRGIAALLARLSQPALARVVVEATGGLETALVAELGAAGLPVVVVNPRQVRFRPGHRPTGQDRRARRAAAGAGSPSACNRRGGRCPHQPSGN
jgi:transposase